MQKVIRRTLFAEKQAARRLVKRKEKTTRQWANLNRQQQSSIRKLETSQIKAARLARREDLELGPLAPRRDVGDAQETYGTLSPDQTRGLALDHRKREEILKSVGGRYLNIVTGDRVVLLEGRDKGKIGKIVATDPSAGTCTIDGLNMVDIAIPKWMRGVDEQDDRAVRAMPKPVPLTSVRLVYPLTDNETGETRDVIVKKLVNTAFFHDRSTNSTYWKRMIPGLNITVPWPKQDPKEHKDNNCDTLRMEVETRTFVPTLLRPPMPTSIIDELRNKYSKFRTRHDPEYIEAKLQEDREAEAKKQQIEKMRTPLKDVNRKERKLRRAKGKGTLTPDMLERLGRVIAQKKQLILDSDGPSIADAPVEA